MIFAELLLRSIAISTVTKSMICYQSREDKEGKSIVIFYPSKDNYIVYIVMICNFTDSFFSRTVRGGTKFINTNSHFTLSIM